MALTLCRGCVFWRDWGTGMGECRRRAPGPITEKVESGYRRGTWPATSNSDGCGEGEPAKAAKAAKADKNEG